MNLLTWHVFPFRQSMWFGRASQGSMRMGSGSSDSVFWSWSSNFPAVGSAHVAKCHILGSLCCNWAATKAVSSISIDLSQEGAKCGNVFWPNGDGSNCPGDPHMDSGFAEVKLPILGQASNFDSYPTRWFDIIRILQALEHHILFFPRNWLYTVCRCIQ